MKERVPRSESQAATRIRLIETATRLIVEDSIPAMSLRGLCTAAGFTQGAFYSNFPDKEALLVEVMERHLAAQHRQLADLAESSAQQSVEDGLSAFSGWLRDLPGQRGWASLALELRLHAQRDPRFGARLADAERRLMERFGELIGDLAARHGLRPVLPEATLSAVLLDLWYAAVLRVGPADAAEAVVMPVLRGLLAPSDSRAGP